MNKREPLTLRDRGLQAAIACAAVHHFVPCASFEASRIVWCSYMFHTYGGFSVLEYLARVASGEWGSELLPLCAVLPPDTFSFLNRGATP